MTAPRLARAGRGRFIIGIALCILLIAFITIFHSSQQQLDESRQQMIRCLEQQESLNTRMQGMVEHKLQIEKNLENERRDHLETKHLCEQRNKELKDLKSNHRFDSLQQRYKLLQSEHKDLVKNCSKAKESQIEDINALAIRIKAKESDNVHWKAKYSASEQKIEHLETKMRHLTSADKSTVKMLRLETLIDDYKTHCQYVPVILKEGASASSNVGPAPPSQNEARPNESEISFNQQIRVSDSLYKIPITIKNNTADDSKLHVTSHKTTKSLNMKNVEDAVQRNSLADVDANFPLLSAAINLEDRFRLGVGRRPNGAVINSVENFQIIPEPLDKSDDDAAVVKGSAAGGNVLQHPPALSVRSSTPSANSKIPGDSNSEPIPFVSLSPTPEKTGRSSKTHPNDPKKESAGARPQKAPKPIPYGVVPLPDVNLHNLIDNQYQNQMLHIQANNNANNRYANVVEEIAAVGVGGKKLDDIEQENVGHEIKDQNDFHVGGGDDKNELVRDHFHDVLDNMNNAAEDDTNNLYETKLSGGIDDRAAIGPHLLKKTNSVDDDKTILQADEKLVNEIVADQGKEPAFPDGMHLEEPNEEDEDEDDYTNPGGARQQEGHAIRN